MKPDELEFLRAYYESQRGLPYAGAGSLSETERVALPRPRDLIRSSPMHHKRAWYLLEKWGRRGWYESGVSIDLGWLTEKGVEEIDALLAKEGA